jgi:Cu/Ag efflux protein CusF
MPAMSMHFKIEGDDVLSEVRVGDTVRFTLRDTPELTRLIYVEKTAAKPPQRRKA